MLVQRILFDPGTYTYLGQRSDERSEIHNPYPNDYEVEILAQAVVDEAGELP